MAATETDTRLAALEQRLAQSEHRIAELEHQVNELATTKKDKRSFSLGELQAPRAHAGGMGPSA
jgi:uncharacterized coiled-coil protein SlyX